MKSVEEHLAESLGSKFQKSLKISSSDNPAPDDSAESNGIGKSDCPNCHGLGYVVADVPPVHTQFGRAQICSCIETEKKSEKYNRLLSLSELGQLLNATFDSFILELSNLPGYNAVSSGQIKEAYELAFAYSQKPEGWLILKGGYGCGKTHLAAAIANIRLSLNQPVLFVSVPDLLDYLRASYSSTDEIRFDERFEQVRNVSLLILDDLGTENSTNWAQEKLYQIIDHRYKQQLPTVITTNQELEAIEPRMRSRLSDKNLAKIVKIIAPDFRRPANYQEQSGLSTLRHHSDQKLSNFTLRDRELPRGMVSNLRRILEAAHSYAVNPLEYHCRWLVFNSIEYGNGKTHLAAAIANYRALSGDDVLFISTPELLDYLRAAFDPTSRIGLDQRFREIKNISFLVLDDLGTESATAWAKEKLYQLINHRYNAKLPTVITSSTPILEIDARIATRLFDDRICEFWTLEIPPYRGLPRATKDNAKQK